MCGAGSSNILVGAIADMVVAAMNVSVTLHVRLDAETRAYIDDLLTRILRASGGGSTSLATVTSGGGGAPPASPATHATAGAPSPYGTDRGGAPSTPGPYPIPHEGARPVGDEPATLDVSSTTALRGHWKKPMPARGFFGLVTQAQP